MIFRRLIGRALLLLLIVGCEPVKDYQFDFKNFILEEDWYFVEKNHFNLQQILDYASWPTHNFFGAEKEKKTELMLKMAFYRALESHRLYYDEKKGEIAFFRLIHFPETVSYTFTKENIGDDTYLHLYNDQEKKQYEKSLKIVKKGKRLIIYDDKITLYFIQEEKQ